MTMGERIKKCRKAPSFQAMHQAETGYSGFYKKFK